MNVQGKARLENENGKKHVEDQVTVQVPTPSDGSTQGINGFGPQFSEETMFVSFQGDCVIGVVTSMWTVFTVQRAHGQANEQQEHRKGQGNLLEELTGRSPDNQSQDQKEQTVKIIVSPGGGEKGWKNIHGFQS